MTDSPDKRFNSAPASAGGMTWFYSPTVRGIASQVIVVALIAWGLYEIIGNTQANLKKLNQNFGFDFLTQASGFDLSSSLLDYSSTSTYGRALVVGLLNTVVVAVIGIILSTIIGFVVGIMRLSKNQVISGAATLYI